VMMMTEPRCDTGGMVGDGQGRGLKKGGRAKSPTALSLSLFSLGKKAIIQQGEE